MAMATRAVSGSVWRGMSASCSGPRVGCGVEPTRKVLSQSENTSFNLSRRLSISTTGDATLRCQAATLTATRESTEVEMRSSEDSYSRAALRGSFEAASASGWEECDGPVSQEEQRFLRCAMAESISAAQPHRLYHGRRGGGDGYLGLATTAEPVEALIRIPAMVSKSEVLASFEAALLEASCNAQMVASLAARAWRTLGDAHRAETLFLKAMELAPQDSTIHASYAEFLWQCDL